jgi:hypothetical protein
VKIFLIIQSMKHSIPRDIANSNFDIFDRISNIDNLFVYTKTIRDVVVEIFIL